MPNLPYKTAGWDTHAKVGREIRFPFKPDLTALEVEIFYEGPLATYVPIPYGSVEPDYSADGVTLYMSAQGNLQNIGGGCIRYSRTWCSLPAPQTVYGSRLIDRPVMHDITASGSYAVSFDNGVTSSVFSSRIAVNAIGDAEATYQSEDAIRASLPHALITIEADNSVRTFYADDTTATIQNALSNAMVGSTAYASSFGLARSGAGYIVSFSNAILSGIKLKQLSTASITLTLTPGPDVVIGDFATGAVADLFRITTTEAPRASTRVLTTGSAHSGAAGGLLALWNGDKLVGTLKATAASGSSVTIPTDEAPWNTSGLALTHLAFATQAAGRYVNGPANCTVKADTASYLPGVSAGITTPADIPLVAPKLDPVSWLTAIVAATAYVVCEGSQLERWLDGPIYRQTTLSVQMSDALDTIAVGA